MNRTAQPIKLLENMKDWASDCAPSYIIVLAAVILLADFLTGKEIHFPILFILPIGLAAWSNHRVMLYSFSVFLPLARYIFYFFWKLPFTLVEDAITTVIQVIAFLLYAYFMEYRALQTRTLKKEIKILDGILPICASCKKIRNEKGEYEQIEEYISTHSEAEFTHGICPDCVKKLYPNFARRELL